jgi:hypothetical protein
MKGEGELTSQFVLTKTVGRLEEIHRQMSFPPRFGEHVSLEFKGRMNPGIF